MSRMQQFLATCMASLMVASPALAQEGGVLQAVDEAFGKWLVEPLSAVLFFDLMPGQHEIPFVVAWLVLGAVFFTLRMQFINVRAFRHAISVTKGDYTDPNAPGEISHFQALASALSATVGLGNIAGVAIAVSMGGPGAVVWMVVAGFLGMSSKFTEVSLGQMYRTVGPDGHIDGGPMWYLSRGIAGLGKAKLGRFLGVLFAVMCIGGSFGGGNMFQGNQSFAALAYVAPSLEDSAVVYGIVIAAAVALVIIGGIKRIGAAAGFLVPLMCVVYVIAALFVIVANAGQIPSAFGTMFTEAFTGRAVGGGALGVIIMGFRRAAFSNEAGVGSASIAHSAASTTEPVREGIVALLEPFVDTIVVCTMTGLVVVISGVYAVPDASDGVVLTAEAFATVIPWFPYVLAIAVVLFAFSTMISWSYYGEQSAVFLFGDGARMPYKILFVIVAFFGPILHVSNVIEFSDMMILGMAVPNILGCLMLSSQVRQGLDEYMAKLKAGAFPTFKGP